MTRQVAYLGTVFAIAFAKELNGASPACEFFDGLVKLNKAKLMALFRIAGDHGKFHNPEKFAIWVTGCMNSSRPRSACRLPMRKTSED
jgi:hypothetical protein